MSRLDGADTSRDGAPPRLPSHRTAGNQVLASVAVVCRLYPAIIAISDVVQAIDRFVGADAKWTVPTACKAELPGAVRLLRRLAAREDPGMDPFLKRKHFSDALGPSIERDSFEIVQWLMLEYLPRGRIRKELEYAASTGQSRTIQWFWEHHRSRVAWTPVLVHLACDGGHVELAKWLHARIGLTTPIVTDRIKSCGLRNGHFALLQWAIELGAHTSADDIREAARSWDVQSNGWVAIGKFVRTSEPIVDPAVLDGHLQVVKWLARQPDVDLTVPASDLVNAPAPLVSWALENLQVEHKESLAEGLAAAARRNDFDLARLLHDNSDGGSCTTDGMDSAARAGHLDMIKWLHENRREGCSKKAMDAAASCGRLDVVEWLHENRSEGCTARAMDEAAEHGHLEMVKWLHAHRTEGCTTDAMDMAAYFGNLEMLEWLHNNRSKGCTTDAMDDAAVNGHLDVVKWLHSNRTEGCTTRAMDDAACNGYLDVVQWLHDSRHEGCTREAMDEAATNGHLEVVQWLHANRHEGCTTEAMDGAAESGRLDIVQWLHDHRTEGCTAGAMAKAMNRGHIHVAQWLVDNRRGQVTWELAMQLIDNNKVEVVKWMLPQLPDKLDATYMAHVGRLEVAQVLQADGRFPLGSKEFRRALRFEDWQYFQWLMREYPGAQLTPAEVAETMGQDFDDERREDRVRLTYMQDAVEEFEQLQGNN